jgi:hypothetical protein|tara:strand:- start:189 stop:458 length:270 start_codon:yes stop_codon:yes gene_type:complete
MTLENIDNNHELVNNYKNYKLNLQNYRDIFSLQEAALGQFKKSQEKELLSQKNELKSSIDTLRANKNFDANASEDEKNQIQTIFDEVTQ